MTHHVELYTDGGCDHKDGAGGWGVVIVVDGQHETDLNGYCHDTTNNRMEMTAIIRALEWLDTPCESVIITSDSQYALNGIQTWVHGWRKYGWKTASKLPVKNQDLWERMYSLVYEGVKHKKMSWNWVKGHSGHVYNERADSLCTQQIALLRALSK